MTSIWPAPPVRGAKPGMEGSVVRAWLSATKSRRRGGLMGGIAREKMVPRG
ncbi:hypothetical protein [Roseomonas sp. CAU 1739]|uniref:hypothetical protein n=1 Tax=Roseomonas sp. CAU 1739 TaxID=3140364 RepID=UPI00325B53A9